MVIALMVLFGALTDIRHSARTGPQSLLTRNMQNNEEIVVARKRSELQNMPSCLSF